MWRGRTADEDVWLGVRSPLFFLPLSFHLLLKPISMLTVSFSYHLLHVHNLSSHAPYVMPAPLAVRTAATPDSPSIPLKKEDAFTTPSPCLEGECPFDGLGSRGKCSMGGWVSALPLSRPEVASTRADLLPTPFASHFQHRLNNWRESMNTHLSKRGLDSMGKGS